MNGKMSPRGIIVTVRHNAGRPSHREYTVWTPNNRVPPALASCRRAQDGPAPYPVPAATASTAALPMHRAFRLTKK